MIYCIEKCNWTTFNNIYTCMDNNACEEKTWTIFFKPCVWFVLYKKTISNWYCTRDIEHVESCRPTYYLSASMGPRPAMRSLAIPRTNGFIEDSSWSSASCRAITMKTLTIFKQQCRICSLHIVQWPKLFTSRYMECELVVLECLNLCTHTQLATSNIYLHWVHPDRILSLQCHHAQRWKRLRAIHINTFINTSYSPSSGGPVAQSL